MQTTSSVAVTSYGLIGPGFKPRWGDEIFRTHPDQPEGQPSLLCNEYGSFLWGGEWLWCGLNHPPPSSAEDGEGVQLSLLYLYLGKTETHKMLETVYGNEALPCMCIFTWLKIFREG
jgi:hypothetical protein